MCILDITLVEASIFRGVREGMSSQHEGLEEIHP